MKVSIGRKALEAALGDAGQAVPNRSPRVQLMYVRVDADGEQVTLGATNLEHWVNRTVPATVLDPGVAMIEYDRLRGVVDSIKGDVDISIESDGESVAIKAGRAKWELSTIPPEEHPVIGETPEPMVFVSAAQYRKAIRRTVFAASPDPGRYALNGVRHEPEGKSVTMVALDGHRLGCQPCDVIQGEATGEAFIVPAGALKVVDKVLVGLGDADPVGVWWDDRSVVYVVGSTVVKARLQEGRFPEWRRIIPPTSPVAEVVVPIADLSGAISAAMVTTSVESNGVVVTFGEEMVVSTAAAEKGRSEIVVEPAEGIPSQSHKVKFVGEYASTTLSKLGDAQMVRMRVHPDADRQAIEFKTEDGFYGIVMPMVNAPPAA